jgi:hypothetical protein
MNLADWVKSPPFEVPSSDSTREIRSLILVDREKGGPICDGTDPIAARLHDRTRPPSVALIPTGAMRSRRRDDAKAGVSADNPPMVDGVNEWEFRSSGSWA